MQDSTRKLTKPASQAVLSGMRVTVYATRRTPRGASLLVQAMPVWLVKTRRAPSRHCGDAGVYGYTSTAMHDMGTPPPYPFQWQGQ